LAIFTLLLKVYVIETPIRNLGISAGANYPEAANVLNSPFIPELQRMMDPRMSSRAELCLGGRSHIKSVCRKEGFFAWLGIQLKRKKQK
jgi:hypothetical protein